MCTTHQLFQEQWKRTLVSWAYQTIEQLSPHFVIYPVEGGWTIFWAATEEGFPEEPYLDGKVFNESEFIDLAHQVITDLRKAAFV